MARIVVAFDGNPFFPGDDPAALMDLWSLREDYDGDGPHLTVRGDDGTERLEKLKLRSR